MGLSFSLLGGRGRGISLSPGQDGVPSSPSRAFPQPTHTRQGPVLHLHISKCYYQDMIHTREGLPATVPLPQGVYLRLLYSLHKTQIIGTWLPDPGCRSVAVAGGQGPAERSMVLSVPLLSEGGSFQRERESPWRTDVTRRGATGSVQTAVIRRVV